MSWFDLPLLNSLSPALEKSLNMALSLDPAAEQKLRALDQCILEIHLRRLKQSLFVQAQNGRIKLVGAERGANVTLSGSTMAFFKLAAQQDATQLFKRRELAISGDAVRAQQIQRLAQTLDLDWEALLAQLVGDTPAHLISNGVRQTTAWTKHVSLTLRQDLEEFIKYELRLLPGKAIAASQFDSIDQLRLATDRLEARVRKLLTRLDAGKAGTD